MILEVMQSRRSIRKFVSEMPDRKLLEQLIEAAVTAPSASNKQPWRFLIITNAEIKQRMVEAVSAAVHRVAAHVEPQFEAAFRAYGDYFTRFTNAPVIIVPLSRPLTLLSSMLGTGLSATDLHNISIMEQQSGIVSSSLAMQNILLSAHALGLGASALTGPLIAMDDFRTILGVQAGWGIVALIAVGYPDEQPTVPPRKSATAVTRWMV